MYSYINIFILYKRCTYDMRHRGDSLSESKPERINIRMKSYKSLIKVSTARPPQN